MNANIADSLFPALTFLGVIAGAAILAARRFDTDRAKTKNVAQGIPAAPIDNILRLLTLSGGRRVKLDADEEVGSSDSGLELAGDESLSPAVNSFDGTHVDSDGDYHDSMSGAESHHVRHDEERVTDTDLASFIDGPTSALGMSMLESDPGLAAALINAP